MDNQLLSACGLICNENCIGGYPIEAFKNWISKGYVTGKFLFLFVKYKESAYTHEIVYINLNTCNLICS